jgi:hypothetical protein
MPIAFHPPTHAPQGATPAHARRDLDDDASTADAFTLLLLAASSVDEPMAAEDATPSLAADAGIPGTPAGPLAADAAAPVVPALAVTAGADPALEAVRAAATAAGAC